MSVDLQFKSYIDRILRCREAEDAAKEDTKAVYAEMKGEGYDKTAAGALVAEMRKQDKNPDKFNEATAILDLYREAYERASHTHAREGVTQSQAKASEDNGRTSTSDGAPMAGEVSRPDAGRSVSATSEITGVTAGETATHSLSSEPTSSTAETEKAEATDLLPGSSATPFTIVRNLLRPHCLDREACAGQGHKHCHRCTKAMEGEAA